MIEKLIVKDPARRYRSAGEAPEDLKERPLSPTPTAQFEAEAAAAAEQAKRKRRRAMVAFATSLVVTLGMAFLPLGRSKPPTPSAAVPDDVREGKVKEVSPDKHQLIIELKGDRKPLPIIVPPESFRSSATASSFRCATCCPTTRWQSISRNARRKTRIWWPRRCLSIVPRRSLERVREVDVKNAIVELDVEVEGGRPEVLVFTIPEEVKPLVNGERMFAGQTVTLATLKKATALKSSISGRRARNVAFRRYGPSARSNRKGSSSRYDPDGDLELADGPGGGAKVDSCPRGPHLRRDARWPLCRPRDLVAGDRVTVGARHKGPKIEITRPTVAAASGTEPRLLKITHPTGYASRIPMPSTQRRRRKAVRLRKTKRLQTTTTSRKWILRRKISRRSMTQRKMSRKR